MSSDTRITLTIEPRRAALVLASAIVFLVSGSLIGQLAKVRFGVDSVLGLIPLFYVDREANLPSWYSSATLLFAALVLWSIGSDARREGDRYARHWTLLAAVFFLLSVDETAGVHELVSGVLYRAFDTSGVLYYAWVVPGTLFVLVLAVVYFRFLLSLPPRTRAWLVVAAGLYVGGALGFEMATSLHESVYDTKRSMTYVLLTHCEELLEMAGVAALVYALLDYRATRGGAPAGQPAPAHAAARWAP